MTATPLSLEDREREYSPSSCIGGDYAPHLQAYATLSAAALEDYTAQRDLAYGGKASNRLDLFLPLPDSSRGTPNDTATPAGASTLPPLLVFIHGGYWQELSKDSSLFAASGCIQSGIAFAAIDYTLAPQASIFEIALECRQALRWLYEHGRALGFDPTHIVVAGSSAGAHLAVMACLRGWAGDSDLPSGLPAGAVLVSGIYDLAPLVGTSINTALGLTAQTAALVSPQRMDLQRFPPSIVCWGEVETGEFKRQSGDFAARIASAATAAPQLTVFEVSERNHFDVILNLTNAGTRLGRATLGMLQRL